MPNQESYNDPEYRELVAIVEGIKKQRTIVLSVLAVLLTGVVCLIIYATHHPARLSEQAAGSKVYSFADMSNALRYEVAEIEFDFGETNSYAMAPNGRYLSIDAPAKTVTLGGFRNYGIPDAQIVFDTIESKSHHLRLAWNFTQVQIWADSENTNISW
jgi:hypothetical protein